MKSLNGLPVFFALVLVLLWLAWVVERDTDRRQLCREIMQGANTDMVKLQAMLTVCK